MAKGSGGEFTVTGTAKSLFTGLGLSLDKDKRACRQLSIRALSTNTGDIAFGGLSVTTSTNREGLLTPGQSYTWGPTCAIRLSEIWVIGPGTSEKVLVTSERE